MIILTTALILSIISNIISYILLNKDRKLSGKLNEEIKAFPKKIKDEVKTALDKQRNVIKGQLSEQIYPLSKDCNWCASEMVFLGNPVDYLVFKGMSSVMAGEKKEIDEILIVDVKAGTAGLSTHQRRIRDAVKAGRVSFVTVRIGDDGKVTLKRETNINNNKKELDVAHHLEDNIIHE